MRTIIFTGLLALAACAAERESEPIDGQAAFFSQCSACHGTNAGGAGPAAAGLSVAPPDLTLLTARNGGSFPRDLVMSTIDGFSRGAHGKPDPMPHFGDGDMGPMIMTEDGGNPMPVPAELLALTNYLQTIQRELRVPMDRQ